MKRGKNKIHVVPSHLIRTDVSDIKGETHLFIGMMFCILLILCTWRDNDEMMKPSAGDRGLAFVQFRFDELSYSWLFPLFNVIYGGFLTWNVDFANIPPSTSLDYFHKLVAENGGSFSMNLNDSVTHCIASDRKG